MRLNSVFYKPAQPYIPPNVVFRKGDIILVNFNTPRSSRFEVVKVNRNKSVLMVKVLKDYYPKTTYKTGQIVDIGKPIFEQDWFFSLVRR